jgi:hypothetical protein
MSDVQLYLAIGIPTFAILIGILTNVVQHGSVNSRFNSVDGRFNSIETRLSNLEHGVDTRFSNLEARMDARFNTMDVKFDTLTGKVVDVDNRLTRVEAKLGIG